MSIENREIIDSFVDPLEIASGIEWPVSFPETAKDGAVQALQVENAQFAVDAANQSLEFMKQNLLAARTVKQAEIEALDAEISYISSAQHGQAKEKAKKCGMTGPHPDKLGAIADLGTLSGRLRDRLDDAMLAVSNLEPFSITFDDSEPGVTPPLKIENNVLKESRFKSDTRAVRRATVVLIRKHNKKPDFLMPQDDVEETGLKAEITQYGHMRQITVVDPMQFVKYHAYTNGIGPSVLKSVFVVAQIQEEERAADNKQN